VGCALAGLASACALSQEGDVIRSCILPREQSGTLQGRWPVVPINLAFHSSFSANEVSEMIRAAETWNAFYQESLGFAPFSFGSRTSPNVTAAAMPAQGTYCSTAPRAYAGDQFTGYITIYKASSWNTSVYPSTAIAITESCPDGIASFDGGPLPRWNNTTSNASYFSNFKNAVVYLNYANYFVTNAVPDLRSIVLHELGHVVGLDHSCQGSTQSNAAMPLCGSNVDYSRAVMAASFAFYSSGSVRYGEQKRKLTDNDMGRGNCPYKDPD
jgi:hypothetical protein